MTIIEPFGSSDRRIFGYMPDGTPVEEITLRSWDGNMWNDGTICETVCKIITYGAAIRSLIVPDINRKPVDVVLGFDTLEDYMAQDKYMGAIVGRYANRIGGAKFTLDGVEYKLAANEGENSLHGGNVGFDKQVWKVKELGNDYVILTLVSPDGQEGYPGTLKVEVRYTLKFSRLDISYRAWSNKATVCNLTNHSYFNLSGHDSGSVEDQYIIINADRYTPIGPGSIPTGEIADVKGTPMDLRKKISRQMGMPIGAHIDDSFEQLAMAGGYDHNWELNWKLGMSHDAACAWSPRTGIRMTVNTDMPGVQFYTGNYLDGCPAGKGGAVYGNRHGFCLETQHFPDTPNRPGFRISGENYVGGAIPDCILEAGTGVMSSTTFSFDIEAPTEDRLRYSSQIR